MLTLTLKHYGSGSVIVLRDGLRHTGEIFYTRKIHRYEAGNDYMTLVTEMKTYGDNAVLELFNYFKGVRR